MTVRVVPARHDVRAVASPRHAVKPVDRSSLFVAPDPAWLLLLLMARAAGDEPPASGPFLFLLPPGGQ